MKQLIKVALCGAYKYSGVLRLQEALAARAGRSFAAILLFHRVTDEIPEDGLTVTTVRFRRMCRMFRRQFRVVPLAEIVRLVHNGERIPRRTLAITFDDCYRDNLFAAQTLAEFELPACFFIPTGYVGTNRTFEWDRGLKPMPNLTWDDVRTMAGMGFEIGSHTVNHPNLATLSHEETWGELIESRQTLEKQLGRPVRWFAYPFGGPGDFRPDQADLVREAGYEGCLSAVGGFVTPNWKGPVLPRVAVPYFQSLLNLELYLTRCLDWFYALKRRLSLMSAEHGYESSFSANDQALIKALR
jgi:peptidoglycan/xylan/chitin deacetylase (PgdA/CDA1 family)